MMLVAGNNRDAAHEHSDSCVDHSQIAAIRPCGSDPAAGAGIACRDACFWRYLSAARLCESCSHVLHQRLLGFLGFGVDAFSGAGLLNFQ